MLAGDHKNSVLSRVSEGVMPVAYSAYGYSRVERAGLGFNGEFAEFPAGGYLLGMGFRVYNTVLMRFNSPDGFAWSPFGEGGLNGYGYVEGDPVNMVDPSGHWRFFGRFRSQRMTVKQPIGDRSDFIGFQADVTQGRPNGARSFQGASIVRSYRKLNEAGRWDTFREFETPELFFTSKQPEGRRKIYPEIITKVKFKGEITEKYKHATSTYQTMVDVEPGGFGIDALERLGGERLYSLESNVENIRVPRKRKKNYRK